MTGIVNPPSYLVTLMLGHSEQPRGGQCHNIYKDRPKQIDLCANVPNRRTRPAVQDAACAHLNIAQIRTGWNIFTIDMRSVTKRA